MMKECAKHCSIMQWSRYGFPVDTALHKTHTNTHGGGEDNVIQVYPRSV